MLLTATSEFFFVLVVQSYSISLVRLQRILEKAFVPSVLVRSLLITSVFDNLEYKKKMIVLENILNYGFKLCMNPAINETT